MKRLRVLKEVGMLDFFIKCLMYGVLALLPICLSGCGSSGSAAADAGPSGFTVSGKITLSNGTPVSGTTVTLFTTSYTIYPIVLSDRTLYGTRDSNGVESVKLEPVGRSVTTDASGNYSFTGVSSGSYTIQAATGTYVFKWAHVPTRSSIGVVTITDGGMVYVYNPDGTGNMLSADTTILYNTDAPFLISDKALAGQDFQASLPGAI